MVQSNHYGQCDREYQVDWQRFHQYAAARGWGPCFGSCEVVQFSGWYGPMGHDIAAYELSNGVELGIDWIGNGYKRVEVLDESGRLMRDVNGKIIRLAEWVPAGEEMDCIDSAARIISSTGGQPVHSFVVFDASVTTPSDRPLISEVPDSHGDFIATRWDFHSAVLDRGSHVRLEIHKGTTKRDVLRLLDKIVAIIAREGDGSMPEPPRVCCEEKATAQRDFRE